MKHLSKLRALMLLPFLLLGTISAAAVERVAAAGLHAQQLGGALVELVVADGGVLEADLVHHLEGQHLEDALEEIEAVLTRLGSHDSGRTRCHPETCDAASARG